MHFKGVFVGENKISMSMMMLDRFVGLARFLDRFSAPQSPLRERSPLTANRIYIYIYIYKSHVRLSV